MARISSINPGKIPPKGFSLRSGFPYVINQVPARGDVAPGRPRVRWKSDAIPMKVRYSFQAFPATYARSTAPGFMIPSGSSAAFTARIAASRPGSP